MSDQLPHDEELRSLYRRLPADEPRAEIDEAILSAAREAAGASAREQSDAAARSQHGAASRGHESQRRRFLARARWMLPLAAAAGVILTVTLTRLTPEQPAVAPSDLLERSDAPIAATSARPERLQEREAELAAEATREVEPGEGTEAEESATATAQDAEPRTGTQGLESRRFAEEKKSARDLDALARTKMAEGQRKEQPARQREAGRAGTVAPAAPPPPPAAKPSGSTGAAASAPPSPDAAMHDSPKSLGYLDGGVGAAPAAKATPAAKAEPAAKTEPAAKAGPPAVAAPASPPLAAMASRDHVANAGEASEEAAGKAAGVDESDKSNKAEMAVEDDASTGSDALATQATEATEATQATEATEATQKRAASAHQWPFGLAPGLDAAEACRRVESALKAACRYDRGVAVVHLKEAAVIDRGELAGRKVTRVTLVASSGPLTKLGLQVEGFATEQILVAPPLP